MKNCNTWLRLCKKRVPEPQHKVGGLRGVAKERKDNLIAKLKPIIPENRMIFWESLPLDNISHNNDEMDDDEPLTTRLAH